MNRVCFALLLVGFLAFGMASAKADTIPPGDPDVEVGGGGLSIEIDHTQFHFKVGAPGNCPSGVGSDFFCFFGENESDVLWKSLKITIPNGLGTTSCSAHPFEEGPPESNPDVFGSCTVSGEGTGKDIFFSGGTGIADEKHFFIAVRGIPEGRQVHVDAENPEPGTMVLVLSGLGALVARRRLRKA